MSHDLTVWGVGTSRTMRVHWMLEELGLEYEWYPIQSRTGETLTDEFRRLNPRHKIPVLRHGSLVLTESAAIIQYLNETFPTSSEVYIPSDAVSRAQLNEWCYFIMSELDAGSLLCSPPPRRIETDLWRGAHGGRVGKKLFPSQCRRNGCENRE
jgi:glutathione S-transferase